MARPPKPQPPRSEMLKEIEKAKSGLADLRKAGYGSSAIVKLTETKLGRTSKATKLKPKNFSTKRNIEANYQVAKWFNQAKTKTITGQKQVERNRIAGLSDKYGISKQAARKLSKIFQQLEENSDAFADIEYSSGDTVDTFSYVSERVNLKDEDFVVYMEALLGKEKDISLSKEQRKTLELIKADMRGEKKKRGRPRKK